MFKAVIFDFDGTLVDSEWAYALTDIQFVNSLGGDSSTVNHSEFVGNGIYYFVEHMMQRLNIVDRSVEELIELNDKLFLEIADDEVTIFPKMLELLKDLSHRRVPMAVASNSSISVLDAISARTGVDAFISNIFSTQLVEHEKPSPDIYIYAAEKLGIDPKDCVVFEDSEVGVKSAVEAGMRVIWFDGLSNKNRSLQSKVYRYYDDGQTSFNYREILKEIIV